jgi:hypothetical protein
MSIKYKTIRKLNRNQSQKKVGEGKEWDWEKIVGLSRIV